MRNNQLINDMKKQYSTIMMLAMMVAALSFTACGGDDDVDNGGGDASIVGVWECTDLDIDAEYPEMIGDATMHIGERVYFKSDGTYSTDEETGRWTQRGNTLIMNGEVRLGDNSTTPVPFEYTITKLTSTQLEFFIDLVLVKATYRFKRIS